jgi:hypothetical protein
MMMPQNIAPGTAVSSGHPDRVLVGVGTIVLIILASLGLWGDSRLALLLFLYLVGLAVVLRLMLAPPPH